MSKVIDVELVLATAERQVLLAIRVASGTTVADVIADSSLDEEFPELRVGDLEVGVWGKPVARHHVVRDGDRIEIYRPLRIDPREARRQAALAGRTMGKAGDNS
jgi:putative ubiquitin-RnfH superfamily antitoxin RatB of RatAB toxin-antitoxin module